MSAALILILIALIFGISGLVTAAEWLFWIAVILLLVGVVRGMTYRR